MFCKKLTKKERKKFGGEEKHRIFATANRKMVRSSRG